MTSAKFSVFLTPSPPCLHFGPIHSTKFTQPPLLHLLLGYPPPPSHCRHHMYMPPKGEKWEGEIHSGRGAAGEVFELKVMGRSVGWERWGREGEAEMRFEEAAFAIVQNVWSHVSETDFSHARPFLAIYYTSSGRPTRKEINDSSQLNQIASMK